MDLFSKNEYVSTNLIMVSVGSGLLGAVLLITKDHIIYADGITERKDKRYLI